MAQPLFRPCVPSAGSVPSMFRWNPDQSVISLDSLTSVPPPNTEVGTGAGQPSVPPEATEDEDEHRFRVDVSQSYLPESRNLVTLVPLDVVARRLPALPDHVKRNLWSPFVPDRFAPTEFLKDVPAPYGPRPKRFLDMKHAYPCDDRIVFVGGQEGIDVSGEDDTRLMEESEPHRYYIDGSCRHILSVTTFLKAFFEPFDAVRQSENTFRTKTFADCKHRPSYKYYGCKSPEDIRAVWKRNARLGTLMHANLEAYFNGEPFTVCPENEKPFQQFKALFADTNWVTWEPFRTEWSIFDAETLIAGQIDLAGMVDRERGEIVLLDWKRCENITDRSFARWGGGCIAGYGPCQQLEHANFIHYSLQLNIYAYILHKNYNLKTKKMFVLQFHPKNKDNVAGVYQVPNLKPVVEEMMAARKLVLRLNGVHTCE